MEALRHKVAQQQAQEVELSLDLENLLSELGYVTNMY